MVRIPAWDYDIDCSEVEILCSYLNSRAPGVDKAPQTIRLMTQIRTCPRATEQGRVKCRCQLTVSEVPTQEAILEEGDKKIPSKTTRLG